jgi:hypothetical protein
VSNKWPNDECLAQKGFGQTRPSLTFNNCRHTSSRKLADLIVGLLLVFQVSSILLVIVITSLDDFLSPFTGLQMPF